MDFQTFEPSPGIQIAYHKTESTNPELPGIIFMSGFMSDMTGTKAVFLEEQCKARGQAYVRFDYTGHGSSSGTFEEGTIGSWAEDALTVLDQLTQGPQIIIGSSMGGWIALLTALKRPERLAGLIGIAPAPDFTEIHCWNKFNEQQRKDLQKNGVLYVENEYADPYPITQNLIEEARNHLMMGRPININCPVRLLHGKLDDAVDWQQSLEIKDLLTSNDVETHIIEDGDHSMSRDEDLDLLNRMVEELNVLLQAPEKTALKS